MEVKTIEFKFGKRHKDYMKKSRECFMNVAEGAVRAGKTVDNVFAFAHMLEQSPDRMHLATGTTIASAKLNIGDANGFGLDSLFRGRCRWGRHRDNECLYVSTKVGERIVIFAGGGKSDSYRKIRGNSYGMWIATEINLHSDSFIKEAFNRQLAARMRKVFWDLNPDDPSAFIYTEYIDKYAKLAQRGLYPGGFNHEVFTIWDNDAVSPERIAEIEGQYDKSSVWYRRDILGQRCAAEGLIYRQFADSRESYTMGAPPDITFAVIGVDFGGSTSAHAFCCVGYTAGLRELIVLDEYYLKEIITPTKLETDFWEFVTRCKARWRVLEAYCDSAEQTLIQGLRRSGSGVVIKNARKGAVSQRIRFVERMLSQRRFFITEHCKVTSAALLSAVYAPGGGDIRLDDGSRNIDSLDAMEYAIEPYMKDMGNVTVG